MKIGNAIVIHIDAETEIRTEAVNTEKGDAGLEKVYIFSEEKNSPVEFYHERLDQNYGNRFLCTT